MKIVVSSTGRIYEYAERPVPGRRRHTVHHPDFHYKTHNKTHFNETRRLCLIRANNTCQICYVHFKNSYDLAVHHKDKNGYGHTSRPNNDFDNLIVLCDKCHTRLHLEEIKKHKEMVDLYQSGNTMEYIGKIFNVSRQRIHRILKTQQLPDRNIFTLP